MAQSNTLQSKITGKVVDSISKEPISFATVLLLNSTDSIIKNGVTTNNQGEFEFNGLDGMLLLKIHMMGYKELIKPIAAKSNSITALGEVLLNLSVKELNVVTILAKRPIIVPVSGGYRVDVENNPIINKNQSALEVLRAIPGVIVKESRIEVVGKNGLLIQVNGLDRKMNASQLANYLSTISGDNIKQIEVIRTPSAAYNSSVGSVINIITKHSLREGYFGTVRSSVSTFNKYGGGFDFSIIKSKFNFALSLSEEYKKSFNSSENTIRYLKDPTIPNVYIESVDNPDIISRHPSVKAEMSYQINDNHIIGGSINYRKYFTSMDLLNKVSSDALVKILSDLTLFQHREENLDKSSIDLYSKYKFKNKSQLILQFNTAFTDINNSYANNQTTEVNNVSQIYNNEQKYLSYERSQTLKSIYKGNFSKMIAFETGTEYVYSTLNDHFNDKPLAPTDLQNQEVTNYFKYNENIAAAFFNLNITSKKWNYSFGLRNEYMFYNFLSRELNKNDFKKNGTDNSIYPSISVNYIISKTQMLTFGLKQNNTRPSFKFYNPFTYLYTPTMLVTGNPDLKPSTTTGADLTYTFQPSESQMYMVNGGISYSEKIFSPVMDVDSVSKRLIFSQQNLGDMQQIYLYLSAQNNITRKFSLQASLMVSQDKYKLIKESLKGLSGNSPNVALTLNGSIVLPLKVNFRFMYNFNSSSITAQGKNLSSHYVNFGIDRSFLKDKIGTSLTITNPFHRMKNIQEYNTPLMRVQYKFISEAAVFRLGLSYKFGKVKRSTIQKQNAIMNTRM